MKILSLALLFIVSACDLGPVHEGAPPPATATGQGACNPLSPGAPQAVTYEDLKIQIFQPKCISCHSAGNSSGGVDLSTYQSTTPWLAQIKLDVVNNIMPKAPNPPLSPAEKTTVIAWVDGGAPNSTQPGPTCNPDDPNAGAPPLPIGNIPVEEALSAMPPDEEITYALVREKIFKFRCFSCHSTAGGNADDLNLETYFNTIDEIDDLYEEVSELKMPPAPRPPLSEVERNTLLRWVELGAPE